MRLSEQLEGMPFKEKADYLWEYYQAYFWGGLLLIGFLVLFLHGILSDEEEPLGITILSEATLTEVEEMREELTGYAFPIYLDHIQHRGGVLSENGYQTLERLSTSLAVGQIDLFVIERQLADTLIEEGLFSPLDQMIDLSEFSNETAVYFYFEEERYGMEANVIPFFEEQNRFEDHLLFIPATARNLEKLDDFLRP